jgi:hypothetical protein
MSYLARPQLRRGKEAVQPIPKGGGSPIYMSPPIDPNEAALDYLEELAEQQFWGFVSIKFENGKVVHLRREENFKPNNLPVKTRRDQNAEQRRNS